MGTSLLLDLKFRVDGIVNLENKMKIKSLLEKNLIKFGYPSSIIREGRRNIEIQREELQIELFKRKKDE